MKFLKQLSNAVQTLIDASQANAGFVLTVLGMLIGLHIVNWLLGYRLNALGIAPRKVTGLPGIACSPFLHGDFSHLFYNCVPLFFLLSFMLLYGMNYFMYMSFYIFIISGGLTWLFGRRGIHVGASGVIMGYFGSIMTQAYHHPSMVSILIVIIMLFYLSGLFLSLLPGEKGVSWEGHVFGFVSGILAVYLF